MQALWRTPTTGRSRGDVLVEIGDPRPEAEQLSAPHPRVDEQPDDRLVALLLERAPAARGEDMVPSDDTVNRCARDHLVGFAKGGSEVIRAGGPDHLPCSKTPGSGAAR